MNKENQIEALQHINSSLVAIMASIDSVIDDLSKEDGVLSHTLIETIAEAIRANANNLKKVK